MKPLFEKRMQTLMPDPSDFAQFNEIIHTGPQKFIRCNTLKNTPEDLIKRLEKKWKVTQPFKENPEIDPPITPP